MARFHESPVGLKKGFGLQVTGMSVEESLLMIRQKIINKCGAQANNMHRAFRVFDKDGSGALDRDEVRKAVSKLGKVLTSAQLDDAMYEMDVDCSGSVDFREFRIDLQGLVEILDRSVPFAPSHPSTAPVSVGPRISRI